MSTPTNYVDIRQLLQRMWPDPDLNVTAREIADAIGKIFVNQLSPVQTGALLTALHFTGRDRHDDVLTYSSEAMRKACAPFDDEALRKAVMERNMGRGSYKGGLCDIVGTGGDSHNTFNISTTSSIIASTFLLMAKHGNRASTSKSGSADLLENVKPLAPKLDRIRPDTIVELYKETNYAFLFAPIFHPAMRYVAPIRKELGWRTIFNLLGPLASPVHNVIEARMLGVARKDLRATFAEALRGTGAKKGLVVCGDEDLDEISCAGTTHCSLLCENGKTGEVEIKEFALTPADFGLEAHPLDTVSPGKEPEENARILTRILQDKLEPADVPILDFVLMNTAALLAVSGICDDDDGKAASSGPWESSGEVIKEVHEGSGLRLKEGVRLARWAIGSGEAWKQWQSFVAKTQNL